MGLINDSSAWRRNGRNRLVRGGRERSSLEGFRSLFEARPSPIADKGDNGWWPAVNAIDNRMKDGDFCWTRDWNGVYYLGQINGAWQYLHGEKADNFDVHCVWPCNWLRVGLLDAMPGAVERSFGPSRTVQAVSDETAEAYTATFTARSRAIRCLAAMVARIFSRSYRLSTTRI